MPTIIVGAVAQNKHRFLRHNPIVIQLLAFVVIWRNVRQPRPTRLLTETSTDQRYRWPRPVNYYIGRWQKSAE